MRCILLFSCQVVSNSLRPHGLQHTRLPCSSPSPRVCQSSCLLNQWCHPTTPYKIDTKKSSQRKNILKNQQNQHQSVVSGLHGIHQHHLEFIICQTLDPILDLLSQKLWVGANSLWPNKLSRWFWCTTNWENHWGKGWAENEKNSARKEKKWEFLEEAVNGDKCCGLKQSSHYIWWNRMFSRTLPGIVFHGWADWGLSGIIIIITKEWRAKEKEITSSFRKT